MYCPQVMFEIEDSERGEHAVDVTGPDGAPIDRTFNVQTPTKKPVFVRILLHVYCVACDYCLRLGTHSLYNRCVFTAGQRKILNGN